MKKTPRYMIVTHSVVTYELYAGLYLVGQGFDDFPFNWTRDHELMLVIL